ncbi:error-prone DNA polymerase [Kordiimonas sp.]|uniref:error-prone DNA polymerase n=1 Tax=Kordiimonas sp. TaxID=1970157 RepID=UPI003A92E51A
MYAELQITSNFSFLRGASHPEDLMIRAHSLGIKAAAVTDRNTLAGIVRAHQCAKDFNFNFKFIPAVRLDLMRETTTSPEPDAAPDGISLLAYPTDRAAYARLTELLTTGNRRADKACCHLWLDDVCAFSTGMIFALLPETVPVAEPKHDLATFIPHLKERLAAPLYLTANHSYRGQDNERIAWLDHIATHTGVKLLATGNVHYDTPERRIMADVLTCVREHQRIDSAGYLTDANAERFLKPPHEMARLFEGYEHALNHTLEIAEACTFSLNELMYNYPREQTPEGITPQQHLENLSRAGLLKRYETSPKDTQARARETLERELAIVATKDYAPYFLTVHDIVAYARSQKILCQGRGSAANSIICYALRITDVDPIAMDLLFERFVSDARSEPPDIDVDFEHERREEVIQHIYKKYGRHRAGLAATTITYRMRSAVRDVGKVMGISEDTIAALAGTVWGSYGKEIPDDRVIEAGFDPNDTRLRQTLNIAHELMGFPRHLSQHVGGFVLTESPLHEIVPIQNAAMEDRTVIEWNKDDLDALNILKVDVLSLGMLTCIRKSFEMLNTHYGVALTLHDLPQDDRATYEMTHKADTIGVFQIESRAQMSMLPRLKPNKFYDLVVQVAIVRPGPIQGNMVHPYLRRRQGLEPVEFPSPAPEHGDPNELRDILAKTYGIPLFQEQAMKIAIIGAKFTPLEADQFRRAMASFRNVGTIHKFEQKFITGMLSRGYTPEFTERCFNQIKGFADYGFPESHAAAFALLAYASAWLKCHYPAVFACTLLNSQPMGFYAPAQIVRDAREHGVEVRPADINLSNWDCTLEPAPDSKWKFALRLGLRQIKGVHKEAALTIEGCRLRPFTDVEDLHSRTRLPVAQIEKLAEADAFRSCSLDRRAALWQVRALNDTPNLPLFTHADASDRGVEQKAHLPEMSLSEHVVNDYQTLRLSLKAHPLSFLRTLFDEEGAIHCADLAKQKDGALVSAAGLVLVRQRPGSAKGVLFMTIEDESGVANIVVWAKVFEKARAAVMGSRLLLVRGRVQNQSGVIHLVAVELEDRSVELLRLSEDKMKLPTMGADEALRPTAGDQRLPSYRYPGHPRNVKGLVPKSRDFH